MKINFLKKGRGRMPTGQEISMTYDFLNWCAKRLFAEEDVDSLVLDVVFDCNLYRDNNKTMAEVEKKNKNYYIMTVDTKANPFVGILYCLSHEMIHVSQYFTGALRDRGFKTVYRGKSYPNETKTDYWESPWEIEAYGRSIGLIKMWLDARRYKNEKWARKKIPL